MIIYLKTPKESMGKSTLKTTQTEYEIQPQKSKSHTH